MGVRICSTFRSQLWLPHNVSFHLYISRSFSLCSFLSSGESFAVWPSVTGPCKCRLCQTEDKLTQILQLSSHLPFECDIHVEKMNLCKRQRQAVRTGTGRKQDTGMTFVQKLNSVGVRIIKRKNKRGESLPQSCLFLFSPAINYEAELWVLECGFHTPFCQCGACYRTGEEHVE